MTRKFSQIEARVQSVNVSESVKENGSASELSDLLCGYLVRHEILPMWGTRQRLQSLREYYFHPRNTMVQGAFANIGKRQASAPWEITGPANAPYWQDVLVNAEFGAGWDALVQILQLNYLRYDNGAYMEIIGPGPSNGPLLGAVSGIATLDPLHCYNTGDPTYPVLFYDNHGGQHLMHHTRVHQIVDAPDGVYERPGWGLCALSRAIAIAQREILMDRYINTSVDDKPTPGIMTVSGMVRPQFDAVKADFINQLRSDDMDVFGRIMFLLGLDPSLTPVVNSVAFSTPPEKFDWVQYVELDSKVLALALGVDPQDILPLSTGNLGTGTQTEILAARARGKTEGDFRTKLTRAINFKVLPDPYEFTITYSDAEQDQMRAQTISTYASTLQLVSGALSTDEIRRYLVSVDDTFRDVLTNPDGSIRSLTDTDAVAEDEQVLSGEAPVDEDAELPRDEAPPEPNPALEALRGIAYFPRHLTAQALKEWTSTRAEFIRSFTRVLSQPTTGVRALSTMRRQMRQSLRRLGQKAYEDGLVDGGIPLDEISVQDQDAVMAWLTDQTAFITQTTDDIYPGQLTQAQAATRAELWANKSLREIYQRGVASAAANAMYKWSLGATEKHCTTCLGLNGQVHRMSSWTRAGLLPGVDKLECKGYYCDCKLSQTNEKSKGSLAAYKNIACTCEEAA